MANLGFLGVVGMIGVTVGTSILVQAIPYQQTVAKYGALMLFNTVIGLTLSPLMVLGGPLLMRAAAYTAGILGSLAFIASNAPSDKFLWMGGPLAMGLGVVFISSFAGFLPGGAIATAMHNIWLYGGLVLFGGFALYDTSKVVELARVSPVYDPVNASISLYMDAVNIFIRLVMIMANGNNNKRK